MEGVKGSFSSFGQLKLWGEVVCITDSLEERFNQIVFSFNNVTNELEIIKGTVEWTKTQGFPLKRSETKKNP